MYVLDYVVMELLTFLRYMKRSANHEISCHIRFAATYQIDVLVIHPTVIRSAKETYLPVILDLSSSVSMSYSQPKWK